MFLLTAPIDPFNALLGKIDDAQAAGKLAECIQLEDRAEDEGMPSWERATCYTCRAWATDKHVTSMEHNYRLAGRRVESWMLGRSV